MNSVEVALEVFMRVARSELIRFCRDVFIKLGVPDQEASDSAEVLVAADARGIASHGVGRLWRYVSGIRAGIMQVDCQPRIIHETPLSVVIDANGAMGMGLSKRTMERVIKKAETTGTAFASIRDSNHFGIAGFYAEMAAHHEMIGICMTNTAALGVPTFGRSAMFGTNPIAFSAPASEGRLFTLDMATTCVTRGKVEVYDREGKALPPGWAVDTEGRGTSDAHQLLDDMLYQRGGGMLPLGGEGELLGGHKGYALAVLVDILTAVTSGGLFGQAVRDSAATSARVCHFFGAFRIDLFRDPDEFKQDLGRMLDQLVSTKPAEGCERVYYAGMKEHEAEMECSRIGIPLSKSVFGQLSGIADELSLPFPPPFGDFSC